MASDKTSDTTSNDAGDNTTSGANSDATPNPSRPLRTYAPQAGRGGLSLDGSRGVRSIASSCGSSFSDAVRCLSRRATHFDATVPTMPFAQAGLTVPSPATSPGRITVCVHARQFLPSADGVPGMPRSRSPGCRCSAAQDLLQHPQQRATGGIR